MSKHEPPNDNSTVSSEDDKDDSNTFMERLNSLTMDVAQSDADATCRAHLYTVGGGLEAKQIAITPAIRYACHGKQLRALCAREYYCLIKIEQRRATNPIEVTDRVSDGRPEKGMFDFHPRHVLDDSNYVQYLVSQSRCPILAGKRMPIWPGVDGSARTRKAWAKFVMCNFVPSDIEQPPQMTCNDYLQWEEHCKTAHASYLERNQHSMVVRLKSIGHYDRLRKSLADDIRRRCRKIWGVRHPLDVNFNAGKEREELKETRAEVIDSTIAEAVQDMQGAIQRAQDANKRGRAASGEEFDILKEALNLQLGLAPPMSHGLREKKTKFLHALGDDDHYPHGDDIYSHAQRVFDDIKAEEESPETNVYSTSDGHISSKGSPDQEEIIDRITNYVRLESTCDSSAKSLAPLVFLHACGGTGKSWVAREIHARLRQSFGWNVVRFVAPSGITASNLGKGIYHPSCIGPCCF